MTAKCHRSWTHFVLAFIALLRLTVCWNKSVGLQKNYFQGERLFIAQSWRFKASPFTTDVVSSCCKYSLPRFWMTNNGWFRNKLPMEIETLYQIMLVTVLWVKYSQRKIVKHQSKINRAASKIYRFTYSRGEMTYVIRTGSFWNQSVFVFALSLRNISARFKCILKSHTFSPNVIRYSHQCSLVVVQWFNRATVLAACECPCGFPQTILGFYKNNKHIKK